MSQRPPVLTGMRDSGSEEHDNVPVYLYYSLGVNKKLIRMRRS